MDIIGRPRIEDDGTKENAGGQHRADFKADRRGHSAKGVQSWTFPRHASLKSASQTHARSISSPALVRGFIVGRMEWSELVEPRHHVRRGVKSARQTQAFSQSREMAALGRSLCWFGRVSQRDTPHTTFAPTVRHYPDPQQKLEGRKQQCPTKRRIGGA